MSFVRVCTTLCRRFLVPSPARGLARDRQADEERARLVGPSLSPRIRSIRSGRLKATKLVFSGCSTSWRARPHRKGASTAVFQSATVGRSGDAWTLDHPVTKVNHSTSGAAVLQARASHCASFASARSPGGSAGPGFGASNIQDAGVDLLECGERAVGPPSRRCLPWDAERSIPRMQASWRTPASQSRSRCRLAFRPPSPCLCRRCA